MVTLPDNDGRVQVSISTVRALVEGQFPQWSGLGIRPVVNPGWDNHTFRLGDDLLVRIPSAERYATQVEKESRWLAFLSGRLPVAIPEVLATGEPAHGYPWKWSVRRWIEGEPAATAADGDLQALARELAGFLQGLWSVNPAGGPGPGRHNFQRGGPLETYDLETRSAIRQLGGRIDGRAAVRLWEQATGTEARPVQHWLHGDFYPGNILLRNGSLHAVIDWGCMGVGDPACDLAIAWTLLDDAARAAFRSQVAVEKGLWQRGMGWTLWKALLVLNGSDPAGPNASKAVLLVQQLCSEQA